jgi:DNA-directed RNA polymerase specialized sigma subunit
MDPLDEALELLGYEEVEKEGFARRRAKPLTPRAQKELGMWHDWNNSGRKPVQLRPLVQSLQPLVKNRSRIFENRVRDIPPSAIQSEFSDQLLGALETFNPNKGRMTTWINRRLMKANRFINTYQNPARIGEKRIGEITQFQTAEATLRQQYGRSPTAHEIGDFAKLPVRDVRKLQKEVRRAHPVGHFGQGDADPTSITPSKTKEIMSLLPHDLTTDEGAVFEYVHGTGGKQRMGTGNIAKKLNMSAPKVSRLKKAIANKWRQYES